MGKRLFVLLIVTALLLGVSTMACAFGSYRTTFDTVYGTTSSYANNCGLCHQGGVSGATRIFYGFEFEAQPGHSSNPTAAFQAIQDLDSDEDTSDNHQY